MGPYRRYVLLDSGVLFYVVKEPPFECLMQSSSTHAREVDVLQGFWKDGTQIINIFLNMNNI